MPSPSRQGARFSGPDAEPSDEAGRRGGREAGAAPAPHGELWVFGYGSLMWRPGFAFASRRKATVRGWRRSLCIYSHVYRGTPEKPGLVLGLDRGGACAGVAFEVAATLREATIRYLREREQVTAVYLERVVPVTLESGERVQALTYVADRLHGQYAGRLDRETMLAVVRAGRGQSGDNAAYVTETRDHLAAIGVHDSELEWLAERLRRETAVEA
ncbi:cation transport protein ChaC [Roseiarcus fermentans]|uniref:glutathione-specific gamma-glutamylcyclotransferase n=1 Tax=Roseiarcus fermentans TaxID=1473586 RepID=A0A366FN91_9HYPH|nr:gamma-glutamylcyclotransferase [Roseiarcus fermentans]RBP16163.1 cation transport protein ChaC [Roseiarcus fermentans]